MENKKKLKITFFAVIVIIVLAFVSAILLFFSGAASKDGSVPKSDDSLGTKAASLPFVTLTFGIPGLELGNSKEILSELQKKTKKDLNINLNFICNGIPWPNTDSMIHAWNESGTDYDAYCLSDLSDIGDNIRNALKEGIFMDIKELFPRYAPKFYNKFAPGELAPATYEGKLGIVPCYMPSSNRRYAVIREDLMQKYNIPEINSYDDFETYLNAIKKNEPEITPLFLNITDNNMQMHTYDTTLKLFAEEYGYVIADYELGIVYKWDDPGMKLLAWEAAPEYREAVERLLRWRNMGFCDKDGKSFLMNKYGSEITNKLDLFSMTRNTGFGSSYDTRFKAVQLYPEKMSQRDISLKAGIAISAKCKYPERVLMFIEWLQSSQENYDLLMYGIKGKNYVLYGDQLDFPKDSSTDDLLYITWLGHYSFMNLDNERTNMFFPPDYKAGYINDIQTKSGFAPHSGCVFDISPVKSTAQKRKSAYCAVEEAIRIGSYTDKTIDDFISEQKKNDVGRLLSVLQKQLDDQKAVNKK